MDGFGSKENNRLLALGAQLFWVFDGHRIRTRWLQENARRGSATWTQTQCSDLEITASIRLKGVDSNIAFGMTVSIQPEEDHPLLNSLPLAVMLVAPGRSEPLAVQEFQQLNSGTHHAAFWTNVQSLTDVQDAFPLIRHRSYCAQHPHCVSCGKVIHIGGEVAYTRWPVLLPNGHTELACSSGCRRDYDKTHFSLAHVH